MTRDHPLPRRKLSEMRGYAFQQEFNPNSANAQPGSNHMQRLTKAAMATGAAAALLLGGAGTMAYWTGSATSSAPPATLESGEFTATGDACDANWTYVPPAGSNATPQPVNNGIVPGDVVQTNCKFSVTGVGDHVALAGATVTNPVWTSSTDALPEALGTAQITSITVGNGSPQTPTNGVIGPQNLVSGAATDVTVTIQVTFDYNNNSTDTVNGGQVNPVTTQDAQASLKALVVTFQQGNSAYPNS